MIASHIVILITRGDARRSLELTDCSIRRLGACNWLDCPGYRLSPANFRTSSRIAPDDSDQTLAE